jgi:hypothetical protein
VKSAVGKADGSNITHAHSWYEQAASRRGNEATSVNGTIKAQKIHDTPLTCLESWKPISDLQCSCSHRARNLLFRSGPPEAETKGVLAFLKASVEETHLPRKEVQTMQIRQQGKNLFQILIAIILSMVEGYALYQDAQIRLLLDCWPKIAAS